MEKASRRRNFLVAIPVLLHFRGATADLFDVFAVSEKCASCTHGGCVEVCPTDAFRANDVRVAINSNECIGCGLCLPECSVGAIEDVAKLRRRPNGEQTAKKILIENERLAEAGKKVSRRNQINARCPG
jgi:Fe-S-cluster-containing dehydrogenase component